MGVVPEVSIDIDEAFGDLDKYYPGSKRLRRDKPDAASHTPSGWDSRPIVKRHGGKDVEFFMPKSLADALGKSSVTIRLWERKGYIPRAPFRLPGYTNKAGKQVPGKRVYTRDLIEIAVEEFASRDLLGTARVEWREHRDLTISLVERWNKSLNRNADY